MKTFKNKIGDSKLIAKVKQLAPHVMDLVGDVLPDEGGLGILKNIIQKDDKINAAEKIELLKAYDHDIKAFGLEIQDRKNARNMYGTDSIAQKILAVSFTAAYFWITYILINHFFSEGQKLVDYELGFMSTLFGALSAKINTIIDFFFGGSLKK
tara:strand:- start:3758 stop:4219 length:462 start_codon:yes stop_codon:yes gene_type:complete